jgi:hypothetical protein
MRINRPAISNRLSRAAQFAVRLDAPNGALSARGRLSEWDDGLVSYSATSRQPDRAAPVVVALNAFRWRRCPASVEKDPTGTRRGLSSPSMTDVIRE